MVLILVGGVLSCSASAAPGQGDAASDARTVGDATGACVLCPVPRYQNSWGGRGTEPGQFIEPSSVELDSEGVVIVAGHEDRVQRFDKDGTLLGIFGVPGDGDAQFNHPHGLAVDRRRNDLLYVGDQENHRLQVFSIDGTFVRQWGDAQFQHIHDVGIDRSTGNIFVGDYELDTLRKFSSTGELLGEYGGTGTRPGQFAGVWGVSTDSQGFVYVADTGNRRVQKLDRDGNFIAEWTGYGGTTFIKPTGVYVDNKDTIYVCDSLAEVIVLFDADGVFQSIWDLREIYGLKSEPEDMVIDPEGKHIFVGEVFEHRVLHLVIDEALPSS